MSDVPDNARVLGDRSWPEVGDTGGGSILVVPVGSLEQHGPHLPLDTDTRIARSLAHRLARSLAPSTAALVAPALPYGASGEHAEFPGTLSVGTSVLVEVVVELVRSARASFAAVVLLSGHGGNATALGAAAKRCRAEGDRVLVTGTAVDGTDAHAGRTETSLMMAIDPGVVRIPAAVPGRTEALADLLPELRAHGVRAVSPNGVLGDPTGASEGEGKQLLKAATARLTTAVCRWLARGAER